MDIVDPDLTVFGRSLAVAVVLRPQNPEPEIPVLVSGPSQISKVAPPLLAVRHRQECLCHGQRSCETGH